MTCDTRLLSFYRDGGLSMEQRYELECHLTACVECTAELRNLMRLAQVIRSMPMVSPAATLRQDVYRTLSERRIQPQKRPAAFLPAGFGRSLAGAGVAASVAIASLVTFRPGALDLPTRPAITAPAVGSEAGTSTAPVAPPVNVTGNPVVSGPRTASTSAGSQPGTAPASVARPADAALVPVAQLGPGGSLPTKLESPATVPGPIARLYRSNRQVRDLLGEARPGSRTVTLLEQSFQGGLAIRRSDTREIYVLNREGNTWSVHPDTWRPGDRVTVDAPPPPGAMIPAGGFGTLWRTTPEIKSRLGWAVYEPRGSGGSIQTFEHGVVVWTPHGLLYVLSNDGRWRTFPDATPM